MSLDEEVIFAIAAESAIARYSWKDRGLAPSGYTKGMALVYGKVLLKLGQRDSSAQEMAKANTHKPDLDALSWYEDVFDDFDMDNERQGMATLRHLFVLLMGLGMRESSGQHCCGRDMSADNVSADTAEAGLFQMSWNMRDCSPEMPKLFDRYATDIECTPAVFAENVSCASDEWQCYGSGAGFEYQRLAKRCPMFAIEAAAVGLRNRRQHWGPINRFEAEVRPEADAMLRDIQDVVVPSV